MNEQLTLVRRLRIVILVLADDAPRALPYLSMPRSFMAHTFLSCRLSENSDNSWIKEWDLV